MDLWIIIKERYVFTSIFIIILLLSFFFLVSIWKNRFNIPKTLTLLTIIFCVFLIILSLFLLIFIISFGYNS
ncbi:membrane-associated HD superfamily phosphohydrolase [Sporosarcina psychrophila]|uniref:Membrane-associated HD superfamily phosphohydrolase n=1 Tax=Sporosarcina psychrophila TaxID=1476 RepID=A0ABV2K252_SPOPS